MLSNHNTEKELDIFSTNYLVQLIMLQETKKQDDTVSLKSNKVTSKNRTLTLYFVVEMTGVVGKGSITAKEEL